MTPVPSTHLVPLDPHLGNTIILAPTKITNQPKNRTTKQLPVLPQIKPRHAPSSHWSFIQPPLPIPSNFDTRLVDRYIPSCIYRPFLRFLYIYSGDLSLQNAQGTLNGSSILSLIVSLSYFDYYDVVRLRFSRR